MDAAVEPSSQPLARSGHQVIRDGLTVAGTIVAILAISLMPLLTPLVMHPALDAAQSAAWLGSDQQTARALSDRTVNELLFGPGTFAFQTPAGVPFYDQAEIDHLRDARTLLWLLFAAGTLAILAMGVALVRSERPDRIMRAIGLGGAVTAVGVVVIGIVGFVAFEPLFELFHRVFFPGGNWAFDPSTERLVQLYPYAFWQLIAAGLGIVAGVLGILTWALARRLAGPESDSSRPVMRVRAVGLDVRIGAGWLLSYLLIASSLVLWFAMPDVPRMPPIATFLAIMAVPALLLPAVVAHELAHALVARRRGAIVHVVDLRLMGVPVQSDVAGRAPATEALVAVAGPAVSGILGLLALGIGALAERAGAEAGVLVAWVCTCLAAGNLLLALVSLYPGAPMDGGQLVHAIARRSTRDPAAVARRTAVVGVASGWVVMVVGLGIALTVDATAGLWLTMLGWFLGRASRLARAQDQLIRLTAGLDVRDALQQDLAVVSPGLTLDTLLAQNQLTNGPDVYTVKQADVLLGVIDIRDVRAIPARHRTELRVADRMRPVASLRSVREDQDLWDAVALLEQGRSAALLVVDPLDPGHLLGLVTRASVARLLRSRRAPVPHDRLP